MPRLTDHVAIVTGASSGIGRAICLAYSREGARVVCADLQPSTRFELSGDEDETRGTTHDRITEAGGQAIFVEVDVRDAKQVEELVAASGLPVLVKGVLRGDDAVRCLDAGAAGVVVSNHGGRQLDRAVATALALPEVADAVAGRAPVLVDGGLRSGLDVLCALALGADAVLLGRPVLWALAADGAAGVQACLEAVADELAHVMGLAGARTLAEVSRDLIA